MHKHQITTYGSDEDDLFVGNIPELPGCLAHGDRHHDALAEPQAATGYWLEAAQRIGLPIPRPVGELAVPSD